MVEHEGGHLPHARARKHGGEVRVESRLTVADPEALSIGMEMELVVVPFRTDEDGNEVMTFAFRPVTSGR